MGRATSAILKGFDSLNERVVLIATTNLYKYFDKALIRRFDKVVDFNRYTIEDLCEVSEILLNMFLSKFKFAGRNINLYRKIIKRMDPILYPGDLKNAIKSSIAFSKPGEQYDYLKRLYKSICSDASDDLKTLQGQGFTVREIELLTGVSKSQVARELKEGTDE